MAGNFKIMYKKNTSEKELSDFKPEKVYACLDINAVKKDKYVSEKAQSLLKKRFSYGMWLIGLDRCKIFFSFLLYLVNFVIASM